MTLNAKSGLGLKGNELWDNAILAVKTDWLVLLIEAFGVSLDLV